MHDIRARAEEREEMMLEDKFFRPLSLTCTCARTRGEGWLQWKEKRESSLLLLPLVCPCTHGGREERLMEEA